MRLLQALRPALAALLPRPPIGALVALDLRPVVAERAAPAAAPESAATVRSRSGRAIRLDEAGRRWVRDFEAPEQRRRMAPHEAVQRFAQWMRVEGYDGWHSAADVLGFYRWWAEAAAIEEMCPEQLWERLASAPGVIRERRRIASTTDPDMVRLRRQTGERRPTLYRIASEEEMGLVCGSASASPKPPSMHASGVTPTAASKTGARVRQPASVVPEARASRNERRAA